MTFHVVGVLTVSLVTLIAVVWIYAEVLNWAWKHAKSGALFVEFIVRRKEFIRFLEDDKRRSREAKDRMIKELTCGSPHDFSNDETAKGYTSERKQ